MILEFVLIVVELLRRRHAHAQLPLPLLRLHLQSLHRIAEPIFLCSQSFELQFLLSTNSLPAASLDSTVIWPCTRPACAIASQSSVI